MTPEPMSLREAAKIGQCGHPDDWAVHPDADEHVAAVLRYARAVAIVDAAVEAHEAMPARLLAAWRAGRDAAAKAVDEHDCNGCDGSGYYDQGGSKILALMHAASDIRALPAPSPTELEQL